METDQPTKFFSVGPEAKSKQNSLPAVVVGESIKMISFLSFLLTYVN
jgi:hypothetical protein